MPRPEICPICGSGNIIPVIYGSRAPEFYDLAILNKAELRGCDAIQEGDPLWHCAECNESLLSPAFNRKEDVYVKCHEKEIARLLWGRPALSGKERAVMRGRNWLIVLIRNYLGRDALSRIYIQTDGASTFWNHSPMDDLSEENRIANYTCFVDIRAFLEQYEASDVVSLSTHFHKSPVAANVFLTSDAIVLVAK